MQLSRHFGTGEAEWSEFRSTTARGLAWLASKPDLNIFRGKKPSLFAPFAIGYFFRNRLFL